MIMMMVTMMMAMMMVTVIVLLFSTEILFAVSEAGNRTAMIISCDDIMMIYIL